MHNSLKNVLRYLRLGRSKGMKKVVSEVEGRIQDEGECFRDLGADGGVGTKEERSGRRPEQIAQ